MNNYLTELNEKQKDLQTHWLSFQEKPGIVSEVLKMLHAKGIEIEKVGVRTPTLEDAFLTLTAKVTANQPGTSRVITNEGSDQ